MDNIPEDLGIKVAVSKDEDFWDKVLAKAEQDIYELKKSVVINDCIRRLANRKIKTEKLKYKEE